MVDVLSAIVHTDDIKLCAERSRRREAHNNPGGVQPMELDLPLLKNLLSKRGDEIEQSVAGTGYLVKTVIGVGTFLLDNEGDIDLLTSKQKAIFDKFLQPLLETPRR
jgi:hypothetical protein